MTGKLSDMEKRIVGEIYSSSEAMDNLTVLCDEFGGRLAGSPENRAAAEFILGRFEEYGFENPHLESFTFPGCEVISSRLVMLEPVRKEVPCLGIPITVGGEAEADVTFLRHGENFERQREEIRGRIVMATDTEPLTRSILAGAEGFILVRPFPMMGPSTSVVPPVLPSVGIKYEDGMMLSRFIERTGRARVRIETECEHFTRESWNVCGEIPGNGGSDEFVMFGGHHDGHEIAQAAFDCGAPSMASLEIGRVLSQVCDHMRGDMRVVLFSAEEFGAWGSRDYAARHAGDMRKMLFTYQFDSCAGGGTQVVTLDYWPQLEPFFDRLREDSGIAMPVKQQIGPDDTRAFFDLGIPTGCVRESRRWDHPGSLGRLSTVWHTCYDTLDKIDMRSLREVITIGALSGFRMINADDWPGHRTAEEISRLPIGGSLREARELRARLKEYLLARRGEIRYETRAYMDRI